MPKKRPAGPQPYLGKLLPPGYVVSNRTESFEVVRTLNHDPAASEIVAARDLKRDAKNHGKLVALKVEPLSTPAPQAYNDEAVLNWLTHARGQGQLDPSWRPPPVGLPKQVSRLIMHTRDVGSEIPGGLRLRLYAMELLGKSLEQACAECPDRRMSTEQVANVAAKGLSALEYVHSNGYVHCDVKPANFLLSTTGEASSCPDVYIIDFGIAKKYVGERFIKGGPNVFYHVRKPNTLEGTAEYKACFVHERKEISRRDDLDAFGYCLLKLATSQLPWGEAEPPATVARKKRAAPAELVKSIQNSKLQSAIAKYFTEVRRLDVEDAPNYVGLRQLFAGCDTSTTEDRLPPAKGSLTASPRLDRTPKKCVGPVRRSTALCELSPTVSNRHQRSSPAGGGSGDARVGQAVEELLAFCARASRKLGVKQMVTLAELAATAAQSLGPRGRPLMLTILQKHGYKIDEEDGCTGAFEAPLPIAQMRKLVADLERACV